MSISSHVLHIAQIDEHLRRLFRVWQGEDSSRDHPDVDKQHAATVRVIQLCLAGLHSMNEHELARTWAEAFELIEDDEGYENFVVRGMLSVESA